MLQKFNITTYAVALCLFAFMLFTAAPVFADPQGDFEECQSIKPKGVDFDLMKDKKNCFKDIAEELMDTVSEVNYEILDGYFEECQSLKTKGANNRYKNRKKKMKCFKDIAEYLTIKSVVADESESLLESMQLTNELVQGKSDEAPFSAILLRFQSVHNKVTF
jgi:hypothetical protein